MCKIQKRSGIPSTFISTIFGGVWWGESIDLRTKGRVLRNYDTNPKIQKIT